MDATANKTATPQSSHRTSREDITMSPTPFPMLSPSGMGVRAPSISPAKSPGRKLMTAVHNSYCPLVDSTFAEEVKSIINNNASTHEKAISDANQDIKNAMFSAKKRLDVHYSQQFLVLKNGYNSLLRDKEQEFEGRSKLLMDQKSELELQLLNIQGLSSTEKSTALDAQKKLNDRILMLERRLEELSEENDILAVENDRLAGIEQEYLESLEKEAEDEEEKRKKRDARRKELGASQFETTKKTAE